MTEKQFTIRTEEESWENDEGCFSRYRHFLMNNGVKVIELNEHINRCWDFADMLNNLHEENKFKRKHILCLQSVIQDIDVEISVNRSISKERFEEIKDHWATKMLKEDL